MNINIVPSKQLLVKSNLPASDYVANAYVGCTHGCRYCYASFMKRFTGHSQEEWCSFLDIKECENTKLPKNLDGKTVLLSSVTDPYNSYEVKYHKSRKILELLSHTNADVEILSKSDLMLRDIDLLKKIPNLKVGISLSTLDDAFRKDIEPNAPSVERRLNALKNLHDENISTYLFVSPIFPYITDLKGLISATENSVDKICFENLNLKGNAKKDILNYISQKYPQLIDEYNKIYLKDDTTYWKSIAKEINELSKSYNVPFINFFYHDKIKKNRCAKNN